MRSIFGVWAGRQAGTCVRIRLIFNSNRAAGNAATTTSKAELKDAIVDTLEISPINGASGMSKPVGTWDVSTVTDMSGLFVDDESANAIDEAKGIDGAKEFNGDLSKWDVSRVSNMENTFSFASSFNGDLSKWDVSRVTDMFGMFAGASSFNSDISKWDVSSVTDMEQMFSGASSFAQTLCGDAWLTSTADKDGMFVGSFGRICANPSNGMFSLSSLPPG